MSPASSGSLEVERYIGACLITQQNRSKNPASNKHGVFGRDQRVYPVPEGVYRHHVNFRLQRCQSVDGWAGGMPLVSYAANQRRGKRPDADGRAEDHHQASPLARLAVHTQGAPLILAKSYNHRKNKVHRNNPGKAFENPAAKKQDQQQQNGNSAGVDTVSVTSDESSGSANSENCLPRIIKPRKRRKKDRKPPLLGRPLSQDGFSTDSASPDIDNGQLLAFNPFYGLNPYRESPSQPQPQLIDRCHILGDISETPKLHHSFDDVEEPDKDVNGNQPASTCQCRYCDPSGQIWDVDRNCYSPFLTPPKTFQFPNLNLADLSSPYSSPISSSETQCLVRGMSTVSLEEEGKPTTTTSPSRSSSSSSCRDLEVSTEIVTSLNGHRDLEIRFFSSPAAGGDGAARDKGGGRNSDKCVVNSECGFVSEE